MNPLKYFFALAPLALLLCVPAPAVAAAPCDLASIDWSQTTTITEVLDYFRFHPEELDFDHCKPYKLQIINNSAYIAHAFTAPDFFKSILLRNPDTGAMTTPSYEELQLAPQTEIDITFVATAPGDYPLWCSHRFHPTLGMKGLIHVDGQQ